jgi:G:T/U-mismatch repair DNA glycosylase
MFFHFHPYKPFLNKDTKTIIMGTLPPPRFCKGEYKKEDVLFCYGSKDNLLWKVLNEIYNLNLLFDNSNEAVEQRKSFLLKNNIGVCDIVESCQRKKIDASDIGMENIELRDILYYLQKFDKITSIIFTGGFCKNSPEYFLRKILKENNIDFKKIKEDIPKIHSFEFEKRIIKTISLTSPSNAANRSIGANNKFKEKKRVNENYSTFDFRVEQYKEVFKLVK